MRMRARWRRGGGSWRALAALGLAAAVAPAAVAAVAEAAPVRDRGVFSHLDAKVRLRLPRWVRTGPLLAARVREGAPPVWLVDGTAVGLIRAGQLARLRGAVQTLPLGDADGDGISDPLDILLGAKKAVLNGASYRPKYRRIPYPNGDVPAAEGVCTDVIVRALRNAGYDLQALVHRDIRRAPGAYRSVKRSDPNIDHRRVRNLLVFFLRNWRVLAADPETAGSSPLLPGDIVLLDTLGGPRPDHIGIVSDRRGRSGKPLIINNWTYGHRTAEMDLLGSIRVTHRFRAPAPRALRASAPAALLAYHRLRIGTEHRQLLVSSGALWSSNAGRMQRYTRTRRGRWRPVGRPLPVRYGKHGLGWGLGVHPDRPDAAHPHKREGDQRSPAGLFSLGPAFGRSKRPPYRGRWPWRRAGERDVWVDDPRSAHYNRWRRRPQRGKPAWSSAERLAHYRLALIVQHNRRAVRGRGSAIFVHVRDEQFGPTVGCTALRRRDLLAVLSWLDPAKKPLIVQLPGGGLW